MLSQFGRSHCCGNKLNGIELNLPRDNYLQSHKIMKICSGEVTSKKPIEIKNYFMIWRAQSSYRVIELLSTREVGRAQKSVRVGRGASPDQL
jgi:hypothetical protein